LAEGTVLEFLACLVGVDQESAATAPLARFDLDNELSIVALWQAIADEFGERSLADVELDDIVPATLGDIARLAHQTLA
jgi:hypothetical protein